MRYCGRTFTPSQIELIGNLIGSDPTLSRYRLSRQVCERLAWRRPDGGLKDMSCRVALLRMQADSPAGSPMRPTECLSHTARDRARGACPCQHASS